MPQAYLDKNTPVAYERLTLGGYRLYYTIDYIFGSSNSEEVVDETEEIEEVEEPVEIEVVEEPVEDEDPVETPVEFLQ